MACRAMISDWELWACAQQVVKNHGAAADAFIADRVADLASRGDAAGVATWCAIAERVDQLRDHEGVGWTRH